MPLTPEEQSAIDKLFQNKEQRAKVLDALTEKKRPVGWGQKSRAVYYSEPHAKQIRMMLDGMMLDGEERSLKPINFNNRSITTIYLFVHRGARFLIEHLDPDSKYKTFWNRCGVAKSQSRNEVRIYIKRADPRVNWETCFQKTGVAVVDHPSTWRDKIERWMEVSEPGDAPLVIDGLVLTPDELKQLKMEFHGLTSVVSHITARSVKLVKLAI